MTFFCVQYGQHFLGSLFNQRPKMLDDIVGFSDAICGMKCVFASELGQWLRSNMCQMIHRAQTTQQLAEKN